MPVASGEAWGNDLPPPLLSVLSSTSELGQSPFRSPSLSLQTSSSGAPWSSSFPVALWVSPECLMLNALILGMTLKFSEDFEPRDSFKAD